MTAHELPGIALGLLQAFHTRAVDGFTGSSRGDSLRLGGLGALIGEVPDDAAIPTGVVLV